MCNQKFYICKHCGNLIGFIHNTGVPIICCGESMTEMEANTVDASHEKHLPQITVDGNTVSVKIGSVPHPMLAEHFIEWVYLQTEKGGQRKCLKPGDTPEAVFALHDDKPVAAFAFCNLHGLWKTEL